MDRSRFYSTSYPPGIRPAGDPLRRWDPWDPWDPWNPDPASSISMDWFSRENLQESPRLLKGNSEWFSGEDVP